MILIYAGSQPDTQERAEARFPQKAEDEVKTRVRGLLQDLKPKAVIGALASGSDIVIVEAAREEGIPVSVVLPFDDQTFRRTSVEPHGDRWLERYDRLIGEVDVSHLDADLSDAVYVEHNGAMLDEAVRLGKELDERVWCLLVRPDPDSSVTGSVTDDMAARAEGRGILTIDINPMATRKRTFVVMPFGTKFDPAIRRNIDCDAAFKRIYRPLLEDLDLAWNRADLATDSGIIHVGMIDDLANSDIVLADLTATNFNVAYELGLRHVFARSSTVLVRPHVVGYQHPLPPFDVAPIRLHGFERSLELSDEEAERAIVALRPALETAMHSPSLDSPVHEWFNLDDTKRPFLRRSGGTDVAAELDVRHQVRDAIRTSDGAVMLQVADTVANADLDEQARGALRIEVAMGLIGEADYENALSLFEVSDPGAESPLHKLWLHQSVMALRRIAEAGSPHQHEYLIRAESLLALALDLGYSDSESYGIWAGLLKRRILGGGLTSIEEVAALELMTEYYGRGFVDDPQPYTGVNYVMALRVQSLRRELTSTEHELLTEALVVARFLNNQNLRRDSTDSWALVTHAELQLHTARLAGQDVTQAGVSYARARLSASTDVLRAAIDQLLFLQFMGEDRAVIAPIVALLTD